MAKRRKHIKNVLETKTTRFLKPQLNRQTGKWYVRRVQRGKITNLKLKEAYNFTTALAERQRLFEEQQKRDNETPLMKRDITPEKAFSEWFELFTERMRDTTKRDVWNLLRPGGLYCRVFQNCTCMREVTLELIEDLFNKQWSGKKGRTLVRHFQYLNRIFNWCVNRRYMDENPCDRFDLTKKRSWRKEQRKGRKIGRALSPEEAERLLWATQQTFTKHIRRGILEFTQTYQPPKYLFTAVLAALYSGLRLSNVRALAWKHLDLQQGTVTFPAYLMKNDERFEAPLHSRLLKHFKALLKECNSAPRPEDRLINVDNNFRRSWRRALKIAELPSTLRFHDLRHSFAAWLGNTASYSALSQLLGHAPATQSEAYSNKLTIEQLRRHLEKIPPRSDSAETAVLR